jgi:hypothetical protein
VTSQTPGKRKRPKTGEARRRRQPLKIDLLPDAVKDRILELRAGFMPWEEIERRSREFVPWGTLGPAVRAAFPGKFLPHTNLHRWYDLRVEQARREAEAQAVSSRTIAQSFLGRGYKDLPESIKNALADAIFALSATTDPEQFRKQLFELGYLVAKLMQSQTAAAKTDAEMKKAELAQEKMAAAVGGLEGRTLYLQAAEDVLKKLRTYKELKAGLDQHREEIVSELAHSAEAFERRLSKD